MISGTPGIRNRTLVPSAISWVAPKLQNTPSAAVREAIKEQIIKMTIRRKGHGMSMGQSQESTNIDETKETIKREVSAPGSYWENGHWVEIPPMAIKREYDFDQVGDKDIGDAESTNP